MIVEKYELELLEWKTRKNSNRLNELLDDNFLEFAQDGKIYSKEEIIKILYTCPDEEVTVNSYKEVILSDFIIHVTYFLDRMIINSNKKYSTLCSSIWEKKNNHWRMIFFQWTKK